MENLENPENHIALFKGKAIRKIIHQKEWWFSVVDVCEALTDSLDSGAYWRKLKQRLTEESSEVVTFCHGLKLLTEDDKMRETDCANTEGVFRIIQSVPSPKAEPLKRWLAKVGYERVQEIEDPELATKRTKMLYKLKGYSESWIEKRMRGIAIREELTTKVYGRATNQLIRKRGIKEEIEFSILTAEISKATFGMTPSQYKKHKGLRTYPLSHRKIHRTQLACQNLQISAAKLHFVLTVSRYGEDSSLFFARNLKILTRHEIVDRF